MINNTSKEKHLGWLFGGNPEAILNQEKEGQEQLANSSQLPAHNNMDEDSRNELEKHGIKVTSLTVNDELFYDVKLPTGWKIEITDHSMWTNLMNHKNEIIGRIFYKAAFYDRGAFIVFEEKKEKT